MGSQGSPKKDYRETFFILYLYLNIFGILPNYADSNFYKRVYLELFFIIQDSADSAANMFPTRLLVAII